MSFIVCYQIRILDGKGYFIKHLIRRIGMLFRGKRSSRINTIFFKFVKKGLCYFFWYCKYR